MSFFEEVVSITKEAHKNDIQLQKDSDVLFAVFNRKLKKCIKDAASVGKTSSTFDPHNIFVDISSKYSVEELLFSNITENYIPVISRLFENNTILQGFNISKTNDVKPKYIIDWTHGVVKTEPKYNETPKEHIQYDDNSFPNHVDIQELLKMLIPTTNV